MAAVQQSRKTRMGVSYTTHVHTLVDTWAQLGPESGLQTQWMEAARSCAATQEPADGPYCVGLLRSRRSGGPQDWLDLQLYGRRQSASCKCRAAAVVPCACIRMKCVGGCMRSESDLCVLRLAVTQGQRFNRFCASASIHACDLGYVRAMCRIVK